MGYTDFVIEKSGISGKYQKASLSSYCGFKRNDPIPSTGKGFGNNRTVPPISYKRLSFSKRDLSTHWETVPFSNCCYFSSCSPQIHSKAIDFWIFSTQELRKENLFIPESEEGTAMMVSQSQTKQRQVTIDPKTSDVDNIRCFSEKLGGGPSTRNTKRGSMVKPGVTRTYQCTQIEIRKASHNNTYKNLQMNNMVALSYIKMIGWTFQDWPYCGIFIRCCQCGNRLSVPTIYELKRMETIPQNIQNDLQVSRDFQCQSRCIKDITSVSDVHIM